MDLKKFGIENANEKHLNFNYDEFYRKIGLLLKKAETEKEIEKIKQNKFHELDELLNDVKIDIDIVNEKFIDILKSDYSAKYLWILYGKYENKENYIDKISTILKNENNIIRGGINTYKLNGWMAHSLYVYQIVNYNIAHNVDLQNFSNKGMVEQINELHDIYDKLNEETRFLLKIFTLIHDIGVIEDVKYHDKLGAKYVEQVLSEIGINESNVPFELNDFIKTLQELIKYHTLITSLSAESSDLFVQNEYKRLLESLPEIDYIKENVPKLLFLLAFGDVIAVDESLMNIEKYERIKDGYEFFEQITKGKEIVRNKEKVSIEKVCDIVGEHEIQRLLMRFNDILNKYNIDKEQFIDDMYNTKLMKYTAPLMKTLNDTELTIRILNEVFVLIRELDGKESLKEYTIIFVPDKHENEFVKNFKNNNFFECINEMKKDRGTNFTYKNINITKGIDENGKYLHIRIL